MDHADELTRARIDNRQLSRERAANTFLYGDLAWPELDQAALLDKVVILPVGSMEQHGPHLPLDSDYFPMGVWCAKAAELARHDVLLMPTIPFGYNIHALDFPGTIHVEDQHLVDYCLDVCRSVVAHGFKRLVIVNGHGSNSGPLAQVARHVVTETDAMCAVLTWLDLGLPAFQSARESVFPGGCSHACEAETSIYLHLAPDKVHMEQAQDHVRENMDEFYWVDLFGTGPVQLGFWTSADTPHGAIGQPTLATAEKGKVIFEASVTEFVRFVQKFRLTAPPQRQDHHSVPAARRRVGEFYRPVEDPEGQPERATSHDR